MTDVERDTTFDDILAEAAESNARVRVYGHNMTIIAEGLVAFTGNNVVGIKHQEKGVVTEFLRKDRIVKIQMLGEQEVIY
ncbi:MAG: hypothetical protein KGY80_12080 [Candidatus Thorarchaeota archaeon]|nr:hypothetical protein [Candidatus Thorarchaeota archaeon]